MLDVDLPIDPLGADHFLDLVPDRGRVLEQEGQAVADVNPPLPLDLQDGCL